MKRYYIAAASALCAICLTGCGGEEPNTNVSASTGIYTEITPAALTAALTESGAEVITNEPAVFSEETDESDEPAAAAGVCGEIAGKIVETVEMSSMAEVSSDRLHIYLNYEIPENCDFSMYICGSGGFADEVFVIMTEGIDIDSLKTAVESRIETRKKDFEDYNPDEVDKLENYYTEEANGYYIYAVTSDNSVCESIFNELVNQ